MSTEAIYLDLQRWPRREVFEFFRGFDKPYFNVCVRLDVAALRAAAREAGAGFSLACHHLVMRAAHRIEPFRYRLEGARVRVYPVVHGSTAALRDDGGLAFAHLPYDEDFGRFAATGRRALQAARSGSLAEQGDDAALLHFTNLPWLHFSSFSHARNWGREDSVPKFAFGRADDDGAHCWMPLSIEVHHALMDGLHVGQLVAEIEDTLRAPQHWLGAPARG